MVAKSVPGTRVLGVILAGGAARRFGGGEKPLALLAGRPIVGHVIDRIAPQVTALAINAPGDPARFADCGLPVFDDGRPGREGPLAGLLAAFAQAKRLGDFDAVLTVPGDSPFLPTDLLARLQAAGQGAAAIAASGGRTHPVVGLWPSEHAATLRDLFERQKLRRVGAFATAIKASIVEWPTIPFDPFLDIDEPDDLATAERLLREAGR